MQFFEFINNYRGSKFLINYFKTLKEPAILNEQVSFVWSDNSIAFQKAVVIKYQNFY